MAILRLTDIDDPFVFFMERCLYHNVPFMCEAYFSIRIPEETMAKVVSAIANIRAAGDNRQYTVLWTNSERLYVDV